MKHHIIIVILALLTASASAVTVPATEDTDSLNGVIKPSFGKVGTLPISPTRKAYVRFDLGTLPDIVDPKFITGARVRVYLTSVKNAPSDLAVSLVAGPWQEDGSTNLTEPALAATPFASVNAAALKAKRFIYIDVTNQLVALLNAPSSSMQLDVGLTSASTLAIGSKEAFRERLSRGVGNRCRSRRTGDQPQTGRLKAAVS